MFIVNIKNRLKIDFGVYHCDKSLKDINIRFILLFGLVKITLLFFFFLRFKLIISKPCLCKISKNFFLLQILFSLYLGGAVIKLIWVKY